MANQSFAAQVGAWCLGVQEAVEAIFKQSAQRLAHELTDEVTRLVYEQPPSPNYPKRTGFLRASLVASTASMPRLSIDNPGASSSIDFGQIELVINGTDIGDTIYLGYTAKYGAYVHAGANGRPPRPWVSLVAQRWQAIVAEEAANVKQRFGL